MFYQTIEYSNINSVYFLLTFFWFHSEGFSKKLPHWFKIFYKNFFVYKDNSYQTKKNFYNSKVKIKEFLNKTKQDDNPPIPLSYDQKNNLSVIPGCDLLIPKIDQACNQWKIIIIKNLWNWLSHLIRKWFIKSSDLMLLSPALRDLLSCSPEQILDRKSWLALVHPEDRDALIDLIIKIEGGQCQSHHIYYRLCPNDSSELIMESNGFITKTYGAWLVHYHINEIEISAQLDQANECKLAQQCADIARQTKAEFLANMSHELRTPLNAIIGFSEAMQISLFGPLAQRYRDYASDIRKSALRLMDVLGDLLELSALDGDDAPLVKEEIEIGLILEEVMKWGIEIGEAREISFYVSCDPAPETIIANRLALRQIISASLFHILQQAEPGQSVMLSWKKQSPQGKIISSLARKEEEEITNYRMLEIEMRLNSEQKILCPSFEEKIWRLVSIDGNDEIFTPSSNTESTDSPTFSTWLIRESINLNNIGLDLNLSKRLIKRHGGHIEIDSTSEGTVNIFLFFAIQENEAVAA